MESIQMENVMTNTLQKINTFGDVVSLTMVDAALRYAAHGWEVFPCRAGGKLPAVKWKDKGLVTTDPEQVKSLFSNHRNANIAFIVPKGLLVLDVDTKEGKVGAESLAKLEAEYGKLPENAPRQKTWSGGYHLLFKLPEEVDVGISASVVGKDLDIRSGGDGYILCEPSSVNGVSYRWENGNPLVNDELDIPYAPEWLIVLASKKTSEGASLPKPEIISPTRVKKADIDGDLEFVRIKSALFCIPAELADDYDTWYKLGMCLRSQNNENYDLWCEWASQSSKFSEEESAYKWSSFSKNKENSLNIASLFRLAGEYGYANIQYAQELKGEALTDTGNAKRLIRHHGDNIRYCRESKSWLQWSGGCWAWGSEAVMRLAQDTVHKTIDEASDAALAGKSELSVATIKHSVRSQSCHSLEAMVKLAKYDRDISLSFSQLDANPYLLCVMNGVVDLRTGLLREAKRENLITKQAHVVYDTKSQCPTWIKFLDRIFDSDVEVIAYIQRAIGYSLTGDTSEQCMFMAVGTGCNGKSLMLNVISALLGDHAMTAQSDTLMAKSNSSNLNNDVARLRGARLVATSETEDGRRLAEGNIKQLTGQDSITARHLYGEFFEFVPMFKLWLSANHRPIISGDDYGIWRRISLIPFNITIPESERDGKLFEKLSFEYSGILNWAIQGCLDWQKMGLAAPGAVRGAVENYRGDMDSFGGWLEACCEVVKAKKCAASGLYASYRVWSLENGLYPLSAKRMGQKLVERGFNKHKSSGIFYEGLQLLINPP